MITAARVHEIWELPTYFTWRDGEGTTRLTDDTCFQSGAILGEVTALLRLGTPHEVILVAIEVFQIKHGSPMQTESPGSA